jgi:HNH endonuclease
MIWYPVVGFPAYEISDTGLVRTKLDKVRVAPVRNQGGRRVRLIRNGRASDKRVNVMVLEAFVGPRPSLSHRCVYVDGDKTNLRPDNLRWARRT